MADNYAQTPEVAAIKQVWWRSRQTPKGEALVQFEADMRHMQLALLQAHYPRMDAGSAERAQRTMGYLQAELIAPGRAGVWAGGRHV